MFTEPCPIKVINTAPSNSMRADEITIKTAKTGKVTVVVALMSIFCKKKCNLRSANSRDKKPSSQKVESANFLEENSCRSRNLSSKTSKGPLPKKLAPKLKKLELNSNSLKAEKQKPCPDCAKKPDPSVSYGLKVKNKTIRLLLDSGSSGDFLFMRKGPVNAFLLQSGLSFSHGGTSNVTSITDKVDDIEISFVEYLASKKVRFQLDIVEYSPGDQASMYDLIIGKQTMHDLGVVLDFKEKTIHIDEILLSSRNIANLQLKPSITRALRHNTCLTQEPISTRGATKRVVEILDAKYEKADLLAIVRENCSHIEASGKEKLLSVLLKFELLFDGTLGDWNLPPVSFELKEGMKPYHGRFHSILHKHKAILMKEIKRPWEIGVLVWQPSSKWVFPTFIIPKKDSTVHTISDFRELNKCIVRKPYLIPKISTILQELEGFTYATALDLNMGYYTIRLDPTASKMFTIIFPWGKYSYKRLPMGFGGSADIFQAQIMDLMASLKFVQAYTDDLLIITRGILDDHLKKWRQCLPDCVMPDIKSMRLSYCSVHMKLNILVIY